MTSMAVADLGRIPMSANLAATLQRATEYARAQSHLEVTLEHLLLALIEDPDAGLVLAASSVDAARIAGDVSSHIGRIEERAAQGDAVQLSVSADLRRILEAAAAAAHQGRRRDINGAIVLAAIVGDAKSTAAHLLSAHGLTFEGAIRALQKANAAAAAQAAEPAAIQHAPRPLPPPEPLPVPAEPHREAPPPTPRPVPSAEAAPPLPEAPEARPQQAGGPSSSMEDLLAQARERVRQRQGQSQAAAQGGQGSGPPPAAGQPAAAPAPMPTPAPSLPPGHAPQAPQQRPGDIAERRELQEPTPAPAANRQGSGFEPDWGPAIEPQAPQPAVPPAAARPPISAPPPPLAQPPRGPAPPAAVATPPPPVHPHRPMPTERTEPPRHGQGQPPPRTAEPVRPGEPPRNGAWPPMAGPPPQPAGGAPQRPTRMPPPLPGAAATGQLPPGHAMPQPGQAVAPATAPPPLPPRREPSELAPGGTLPQWAGEGSGRPPDMAARTGERARGPVGPPGPQAAADRRARAPAVPTVEIGQLVENIPKTMRVGIAEKAEVRIGKADVRALAEGLQGGGGVWRHDVVVTKAMSVRLRAPDGGFFIESGSPETQWIENTLGLMADDYASWRWTITPKDRGWKRLQLVVSARTVGGDGVAAETALPDQVIDVRVRTNYGRAFARVGGWALAALAGGVVAKVGEGAFVAAWTAMLKGAGG